jgi:tRNA-dihydrouridine synthase B
MKRLGIDFPFLIAPMVGLSHVAFRELIRSYTPPSLRPLLFTEMLSTRRLPNENLHQVDMLMCAAGERNFVPQLLGNEERFIAPSIEKLLPLGPWGFDINMGCPQKKTLAHNWGVLLMGDRDYAAEVVRITKKNSPLPVSVKLRAGMGQRADLEYLLDFTSALEDAGADWLTIHCRAKGQGHKGEARWDVVGELKKKRRIPVVANGDLQNVDDALKLLNEFGVDGAMIARAATARPWILWQIANRLGITETPPNKEGQLPPFTPEEEGKEYFYALLRLTCLLQEFFGDTENALRRLRFFIATNHRWLMFGHQFWKASIKAKDLVQMRDLINDFLNKNPQPMSKRVLL